MISNRWKWGKLVSTIQNHRTRVQQPRAVVVAVVGTLGNALEAEQRYTSPVSLNLCNSLLCHMNLPVCADDDNSNDEQHSRKFSRHNRALSCSAIIGHYTTGVQTETLLGRNQIVAAVAGPSAFHGTIRRKMMMRCAHDRPCALPGGSCAPGVGGNSAPLGALPTRLIQHRYEGSERCGLCGRSLHCMASWG